MTRIRVTEKCCWPERIGCTGTIVVPTRDQAKIYPFHGLAKNEVVVKLDIDPLERTAAGRLLTHFDYLDDWWTCVLTRDMYEYVPTDADLGLS